MDPSTSSAQDVQNQQSSDDQSLNGSTQSSSVNQTQPASQEQSSHQATPQPRASTMISVGAESSPAMIVQENPDADDEDEDELVAPQETKNLGVMGQGEEGADEQQVGTQAGGADMQGEIAEIQPAVPEVSTGSVEVEKVIEKSPDQEKPDIPQEVLEAGITHSGPGVIPGVIEVTKDHLEKVKLPVSYLAASDQVKKTGIHSSKHWFMGMIMYIWRKVNPSIEKAKIETVESKDSVAEVQPIALETPEVAQEETEMKEAA